MLDKKLEISKNIIYKFVFGWIRTNCYIVKNNNDIVIIDPSATDKKEQRELIDFLKSLNGNLRYIVNTHGHFDHIAGNAAVKEAFPDAKIVIHKADRKMLTSSEKNGSQKFGLKVISPDCDEELKDEEKIYFGDTYLYVIHTPGHTEGSICLKGKGIIFTGDTLLAGTVGTTTKKNVFNKMIKTIKEKILTLGDDYIILPGHMENSTIKEEKTRNPFLITY